MNAIEAKDKGDHGRCVACAGYLWHVNGCERIAAPPVINWERVGDALDVISEEFARLSQEKGWWGPESFREDGRPTDAALATEIALTHSELSEALDEARNGRRDLWFGEGGKPEGFGVELVDTLIRTLLLAKQDRQPLGELLRLKHEYNKTRPRRHGGKRF